MIQVESVAKQYGSVTAVDGVSFSVDTGEIFGLLGPNGAGKSTLLDVILGYTEPTSGSITALGHDTTTESVLVRKRMGVLPEATTVHDRLTGREHIQMAADVKNVEVETNEVLSTVGLSETEADQRAGGYSKGMCQRLLLGTALVGDPDLLVLDEPSSGLDPNGARELRQIVRQSSADGTTVLFSTHRLPEAEAVCDRVGILDDGQLVETADVAALTANQRTTVGFDLESSPTPVADDIRTFEGVASVTVDEAASQLSASVTDTGVKAAIFRHLDEAATVRDFWTKRSSVSDFFETSVGDQRVEEERPTEQTRNSHVNSNAGESP